MSRPDRRAVAFARPSARAGAENDDAGSGSVHARPGLLRRAAALARVLHGGGHRRLPAGAVPDQRSGSRHALGQRHESPVQRPGGAGGAFRLPRTEAHSLAAGRTALGRHAARNPGRRLPARALLAGRRPVPPVRRSGAGPARAGRGRSGLGHAGTSLETPGGTQRGAERGRVELAAAALPFREGDPLARPARRLALLRGGRRGRRSLRRRWRRLHLGLPDRRLRPAGLHDGGRHVAGHVRGLLRRRGRVLAGRLDRRGRRPGRRAGLVPGAGDGPGRSRRRTLPAPASRATCPRGSSRSCWRCSCWSSASATSPVPDRRAAARPRTVS